MLNLHRAMRTDVLADALAEVLATPLADPMAAELVVVPARGVERWLHQHLARRLGVGAPSGAADGVAANIDFASPGEVTDLVIDQVSGAVDLTRYDRNPWRSAALVWHILEVLEERLVRPDMAILARHLGASSAGGASAQDSAGRVGRRYGTARHIADLFIGYGRQRPDMVSGWLRGADTDGVGGTLPKDMQWQPGFFRAVADRIGTPHQAQLLPQYCAEIAEHPKLVDLPERFAVFGPTRLTASFRNLLDALATHREVHVFIAHPSPALWDSLAPEVVQHPKSPGSPAIARSDRPKPEITHPLLASLSRDVQELQLTLAPIVDSDTLHTQPPLTDQSALTDQSVPMGSCPAATESLLTQLQADLQADAPLPAGRAQGSHREARSASGDGIPGLADLQSVEIHACHGPERQVEVLRDRLLHLFNADPTLQPRDVVIMCPDVETFAPLIRGAFGQPGLNHPAFSLRVRLADRGLRFVNPVIEVVDRVIGLAVGRVSAADVADLLALTAVQQRFRINDDELDTVRRWLSRSEVRWGLGRTQRARFGLADFPQGTVDTGLDRIALGVVADERDGRWLGTALPMDGIDSTQIDLFGRVAEFVSRLSALLDAMSAELPATAWTALLDSVIGALTATAPGDEWQSAQARRMVAESIGTQESADAEALRLHPADVCDAFSDAIAARPSRANFRTGELTVCTMVPMRSVPHRVIALLGIDADAFPRAQRLDGDDVLGRSPLVGERNPRDEDRQLFLDTICAATERLLVCFTGADPVTGATVPPAVVVSELIDAAAARRGCSAEEMITRHPLHGFDRRNFQGQPFSFDPELAAAARAGAAPALDRPATSSLAALQLPPEPGGDIEAAELIAFFANPYKAFLRQRLGASIPDLDDEPAEELATGLRGLDEWEVGERIVRGRLIDTALADLQHAELRRGNLPPFQFGQRELRRISGAAEAVADAALSERNSLALGIDPQTRDVVVTLSDGRRVHGSIANIYGDTIINATYSRVKAKLRITSWLQLLLASCGSSVEFHDRGGTDGHEGGAAPMLQADPMEQADPVVQAVTVGRADRRGGGVSRLRLRAPAHPLVVLERLVRIRDRGLQQVLPMPIDASSVYAERRAQGQSEAIARSSAERTFDSPFGAANDPALRLMYRGDTTVGVPFAHILQPPAEEPHSDVPLFCQLAEQVWSPIAAHEGP